MPPLNIKKRISQNHIYLIQFHNVEKGGIKHSWFTQFSTSFSTSSESSEVCDCNYLDSFLFFFFFLFSFFCMIWEKELRKSINVIYSDFSIHVSLMNIRFIYVGYGRYVHGVKCIIHTPLNIHCNSSLPHTHVNVPHLW